MFEWTERLWLDYTNPNSPTILNDEVIPIEASVGDLQDVGEIAFKKTRIKAVPWPVPNKTDEWGNTGVPKWVQYPEFQISPSTGKPMEFICQLSDIPNFDGCLYVFYCKHSKVVCYLYQGT